MNNFIQRKRQIAMSLVPVVILVVGCLPNVPASAGRAALGLIVTPACIGGFIWSYVRSVNEEVHVSLEASREASNDWQITLRKASGT